ncbi:hypothetical protein BA900_06000 [Spiribacter roseus]|nr:hypothetical protein BA900_06000 [Spiribacter roseus]
MGSSRHPMKLYSFSLDFERCDNCVFSRFPLSRKQFCKVFYLCVSILARILALGSGKPGRLKNGSS